jgi:hypothetical protein
VVSQSIGAEDQLLSVGCRYTFKKQAVELKRKMWWKNMKMTLLIVVPCIIGIFFTVMYPTSNLLLFSFVTVAQLTSLNCECPC